MSDEEKKAIETFKQHIEFCKEFPTSCYDKEIEIVLNYIDKLEKEIEQLKEIKQQICNEELINISEYFKLKKENETLKEENFDQVYMKAIADYKDKIRNKIKELEELRDSAVTWKLWHRFNSNIHILEELLKDEEND